MEDLKAGAELLQKFEPPQSRYCYTSILEWIPCAHHTFRLTNGSAAFYKPEILNIQYLGPKTVM